MTLELWTAVPRTFSLVSSNERRSFPSVHLEARRVLIDRLVPSRLVVDVDPHSDYYSKRRIVVDQFSLRLALLDVGRKRRCKMVTY